MTSVGTLLAFVLVSAGVWVMRRTHPELNRPFRTPMVPLVPILSILFSGLLIVSLVARDADPAGGVADHRVGDLFQLRTQAQQGAGATVARQGQWSVILVSDE